MNVGGVSMSTHTGTHADAPLHVQPAGAAVETLPLRAFVGRTYVVHVEEAEAIQPEHLAAVEAPWPERVLFKTCHSGRPPSEWSTDFPHLLPETVAALAEKGVRLVGTDAPSVDPAASQSLPAHHALFSRGMVNLENLFLRDVPAGSYWLVALPLRLVGMDAAPVRAVLFDTGGTFPPPS